MGLTLISLAVALTSLAYVTYSWFIFQRSANISALEVIIEKGISYELKYFVHNETEGYPSSNFSSTDVDVTVSDYENEFLPVASDFHQYTLALRQPAYRLTYALELSLEKAATLKQYEIIVGGFTSEASTLYYNYATNKAIESKEAINIYTTVIDGDLSNSLITSEAASFVSAQNPSGGDKFDGNDEFALLDEVTFGKSANPQKKIFLFTIEFSNDPNSYYNFKHYSQGLMFFEKSPLGNSNVYQNLTFSLDSILIQRTN